VIFIWAQMRNQSNHIIDFVGLIAPVAALQAVEKFREMRIGECLEIKNCNHETKKIILRFFPKSSYQLLHKEKMPEQSFLYRIVIQKTGEI